MRRPFVQKAPALASVRARGRPTASPEAAERRVKKLIPPRPPPPPELDRAFAMGLCFAKPSADADAFALPPVPEPTPEEVDAVIAQVYLEMLPAVPRHRIAPKV